MVVKRVQEANEEIYATDTVSVLPDEGFCEWTVGW